MYVIFLKSILSSFLECPIGTYGFWCNQTCDNCLDNKCIAISGVCESGCNDGWVGNKCEQGTVWLNCWYTIESYG